MRTFDGWQREEEDRAREAASGREKGSESDSESHSFLSFVILLLAADFRVRRINRGTTVLQRQRNFGAHRLHFWGIGRSICGFAGCIACKGARSLLCVWGNEFLTL